jgi:uncharacterized protein (DUF1800 family)
MTRLLPSPQQAWLPLPDTEWDAENAQHLLRRVGWTARPEEVERGVHEGLPKTLERLFPTPPPLLAKPRLVEHFEENALALARSTQTKTGEERLRATRELQERARVALTELSIKWLEFAARPENAAFAKWVLFLSDVYVVSADKVRNPGVLWQHFDVLARHALGPAPALTKAVSRSPAMVIYLDLNQSQLKAPNENFARELFELFVLGEGNYTEQDIKESARAFTGYRARQDGVFRYDARQHDVSPKTIFGATGKFTGDDVIELAYSQPAASMFLPKEMARFYLSDGGLTNDYAAALGDVWRASGFELQALLRQFFGSRMFFTREFHGNFIKSPVQYYLGLVQDMQLDVAPIPRLTLNPLRQMGQALFLPPNVRGWVGGRNWINSATLVARRQLTEMLFNPLDERALNADEQFELVAARSNGIERFTVADEWLESLAALEPAAAAEKLAARFLPGPSAHAIAQELRQFLASGAATDPKARLARVRRAAVTILQSPEYQLC